MASDVSDGVVHPDMLPCLSKFICKDVLPSFEEYGRFGCVSDCRSFSASLILEK